MNVIRLADRLGLNVDVALLKHEILAVHSLPDVLHVVDDSLEVRSRVVRAGDEDVVGLAAGRGGIYGGDGDEPAQTSSEPSLCQRTSILHLLVVNGAKELKTGSKLLFGLVSLDDGADDRNVDVLRANIVRRRHASDVDV